MEEKVKMFVDDLIGQAKTAEEKLKLQGETEGQIMLPQVLADSTWTNNEGDEFEVAVVLTLSQMAMAEQLGLTSLKFVTCFEGMLVTDSYMSGLLGNFSDTVISDKFRQETEKFVNKLMTGDGSGMKSRIRSYGTYAIDSLVIPEAVQNVTRRIPSYCTLSVSGEVFAGIDAIKDYVRSQTESSKPYIIVRGERFPCFDSEDFATEHRFYRNFLFCQSKQDAVLKQKKMARLKYGHNNSLVNNSLPADMRPMVYYMDETDSMVVAF